MSSMTIKRLVLLLALGALLAFVVAGCGDANSNGSSGSSGSSSSGSSDAVSGNIAGAGSSAQDAAMQAWIAGLQSTSPDATVSYDPVGSGGGREQFVSKGVDFAGSDSALADAELSGAQDRCGGPDNLIEIPVYVSPIAIIYNLDGVKNLQLSPETAAKIFKQDIKSWNDPAIAKDNPGAKLPAQRISPVNRSDESGTTDNFTDWLHQAAPDVWTFDHDGNWPVKGGEAAEGTSGVVDAVKNGKGTIGYADESQARDLGVAKIKVGSQYVAPSADAAAAVLDKSKESSDAGKYVFTYTLDRTVQGTYPVTLVSYQIACTKYDSADKGKLVKALYDYIISSEGQDAAAKNAGSAPISDALRQKIQPAVDAIGSGT
jgi:phosphate transport system substrate-binding protein